MDIEVTRDVLAAMRDAARAEFPLEACGILLGDRQRIDRLRVTQNVHVWPENRFEIDPRALIDAHRAERAGGDKVLGYFHSHPSTIAKPSGNDCALAAHDGKIWAIHGTDGVTFWRDDEAAFVPLSYREVDA